MAYKCREEIVGKRFLSVSIQNTCKTSKITDWEWRAGVIRAASHSDPKIPELSVLVEYDDTEWKRREWIKVYEDNIFGVFLIENTLIWATRENPNGTSKLIDWPALKVYILEKFNNQPYHDLQVALELFQIFTELVDKPGLANQKVTSIEFLSDKHLEHVENSSKFPLYQPSDLESKEVCIDYPEVAKAIKEWTEYQDGQRILLTTPSVLVGYRVEVYRSEGTTQWYTAVIISYNDNTKELTVTDDTVLEDHNEEPCLVQMKLLGDGVVESILKGENVGITPRRRSCNNNNNNQHQNPQHQTRTRSGHLQHNSSTSQPGNSSNNKTTGGEAVNNKKSRRHNVNNVEQQPSRHTSSSNQAFPSKTTTNGKSGLPEVRILTRDKKRKSSISDYNKESAKLSPKVVIHKFEQSIDIVTDRSVTKKSVENCIEKKKKVKKEPKSEKDLPADVTEHILSAIECVIKDFQPLLNYSDKRDKENNLISKVHLAATKKNIDRIYLNSETDTNDDRSDSSIVSAQGNSVSAAERVTSIPPKSLISSKKISSNGSSILALDCIVESSPSIDSQINRQVKCDGDCSLHTSMDSVENIHSNNSKEFSDNSHSPSKISGYIKPLSEDRQSDSGISEKLSSAQSSEGSLRLSGDERSTSRSSESSRLSDNSDTIPFKTSLKSSEEREFDDKVGGKHCISPLVFNKTEPVKVWRDPELLNSSSQNIRHITSVQHNSMQHPNSNSQPAYPATLGGHHSAPPPGVVGMSSPHQHSRPGTAPLPVSATSTASTSAISQLPFHSGLASLSGHHPPTAAQPSQLAAYGHPLLSHSHQSAAAMMMSQYGSLHHQIDLLSQQKFPPGAPWSLQQVRDSELLLGRERAIAAEWERAEREKREKQGRDRLEKEKKEAEEMEKQQEERERAEREVQQHFEESLRLANQKKAASPWNPIGGRNPTPKTIHSPLHSNNPTKDIHHSAIKKEHIPADAASRYSVLAMDARYKQELVRKQEEEKQFHEARIKQELLRKQEDGMIRHHKPTHYNKNTSEVSQGQSYRSTLTSNSSANVNSSKTQASFSLYGYQPFQHSYITPDTAHRALLTEGSKNQGSIMTGKPLDRLSSSATSNKPERHQPKPMHPTTKSGVGAFKPYEQFSSAAVVANKSNPNSGLLRIAEPENLSRPVEKWSSSSHHHHLPNDPKTSPKSKSSHHSLVQQGLVPNPMYTRPSPSSPRPAHMTPGGIRAGLPVTTAPSPAHMSNPSHHRMISSVPPSRSTVINDNNVYKPLSQSGHQVSRHLAADLSSVSSLPQGQPLDLQCSGSKRKSLDSVPDSPPKKVKQEAGILNSLAAVCSTNNNPSSKTHSNSASNPKFYDEAADGQNDVPSESTSLKHNLLWSSSKFLDSAASSASVTATAEFPSANKHAQIVSSTSTAIPVNSFTNVSARNENAAANNATQSPSSNSNGSNSSTSCNPVTKLKKAWLQRHSGEDSNSSFSGSCTGVVVKCEPAAAILVETASMPSVSSGSRKLSTDGEISIKEETLTPSLVNGHVSDASTSSSSEVDQEIGGTKRKSNTSNQKGSVGCDLKKQKIISDDQQVDSEKGSDDSKVSKEQPKKRGRRPKDHRPVEEKKKPSKQQDKSLITVSKTSADTFLQNGSCCEVAPKLSKCRECRMTPHQRNKNLPNIFCRFYEFRKLKHGKNNTVSIGGFSEPDQASDDDLKLWLPRIDDPPTDLDVETSKFLLAHVGDQFCDLVEQEREAQSIHMGEDKTVTWKRVVQGVREMCDVCETTLFNIHWVCHKCGFVICIDCYKARKNATIKATGNDAWWSWPGKHDSRFLSVEEPNPPKDRDGYHWLFCNNKHPHDQSKLMLTQIIAGNALWEIGRLVHEVRKMYNIPAHCNCCDRESRADKKPINGINKKLMSSVSKSLSPEKSIINGRKLNGVSGKEVGNYASDTSSPLSWLADVALTSSGKLQADNKESKLDVFEYPGEDQKSESDNKSEDNDENFSTLRELLIRPHPGPKSSLTGKNCVSRKAVSNATTLDDVINCVIEQNIKKSDVYSEPNKEVRLVHFTRRYPHPRNGRESLPVRVCTLAESKSKYPDLPHSWLCGGRLLRIHDPSHKDNIELFQEQWKRGQPVLVSDVAKNLDKNLWHPWCFSRDFGEVKADLVNCRNGSVISSQPIRKFWDGFDSFAKRIRDEETNDPALLKLKDWPPGDDFSEVLPRRYGDLMKALPLPMYTHRDGVHNLAGRLPDCFVRPDLGPKMYNAYGLAQYPDTGTTNLHLDMSDAVNVMVYVGIPEDGNNKDHIKMALQAIDECGCDALTRERVHDNKEKPGALWHIYNARDADKIRDLLNKVAIERGETPEPHHDPIHDQSWYLNKELRNRLYKEYGVEGYAIVQCLGDCVFIPAGAPHQVQNLHSCVKVAEDFVSPENISHCFTLTEEFRALSDTHTNHEDKLQIKNIIFHAIKDGLAVLMNEKRKQEKDYGDDENS